MGTTLRQANNTINVTGILQEKKLEQRTKDGKTYIFGHLILKTGENSFVKVKVMSFQLKKDGTEGNAFKAFQTVMKEYVSIIDAKGDEEKADIVSVIGSVDINDYFDDKTGEVKSYPEYKCNYVSRVDVTKTPFSLTEVNARGNAEVFIELVTDEMRKKGEEMVPTGGKVINGVVPIYGGKVFPISLVIPKEDTQGIGFFEDLDPTTSINIYFNIYNAVVKAVVGGGNGGYGDKGRVVTNTINKLLVLGADAPYDEYDEEVADDQQKAFSPQAIRLALQERKNMLAEKKANGSTAPKGKVGYGNGASTTNVASVPVQEFDEVEEDLENELPF